VTEEPGVRPALLLAGPPAAGKSTVAGLVAAARSRCVRLEVDDVRQFVMRGAEAPWRGDEGAVQDRLAAEQAARLTRHYLLAGFDVVITDVLLPAAATVWSSAEVLPLVVWLAASRHEARKRAGTRPVHLTWAEFDHLHDIAQPPAGARIVDTDGRSDQQVADVVEEIWRSARS
jgi:predicted kinase